MAASIYGAITIATAATNILPANSERSGSLVANNSNQTVYLGMDSSLSTSNGLPLAAGAIFNNSGQNAVWKGAIWGIVSGTTADVRYWEYLG